VSQSLAMLNDDFVIEQAGAFAARVMREAPDRVTQIERAFQLALARKPGSDEVTWAGELLDKQAERFRKSPMTAGEAAEKSLGHLCQMLLNTNEFLYIH
jgi:hypothetical protein